MSDPRPIIRYVDGEKTTDGCFYCKTVDDDRNYVCGKCTMKIINTWKERIGDVRTENTEAKAQITRLEVVIARQGKEIQALKDSATHPVTKMKDDVKSGKVIFGKGSGGE